NDRNRFREWNTTRLGKITSLESLRPRSGPFRLPTPYQHPFRCLKAKIDAWRAFRPNVPSVGCQKRRTAWWETNPARPRFVWLPRKRFGDSPGSIPAAKTIRRRKNGSHQGKEAVRRRSDESREKPPGTRTGPSGFPDEHPGGSQARGELGRQVVDLPAGPGQGR